jgi:hypothetical protein
MGRRNGKRGSAKVETETFLFVFPNGYVETELFPNGNPDGQAKPIESGPS